MAEKADKRAVIVTGASGAGRTTAINAFEDMGFDTVANIPLLLLDRLFEGPGGFAPIAIGIDVRNRDFSTDTLINVLDRFSEAAELDVDLLFLDCRLDVLMRRYSETRRRHPMATTDALESGIHREMEVLRDVRSRADHVIDTSDMSPHALRAEIERLYGQDGNADLVVSVESFSYKRGLPRGVDMIFDVRFLTNPHWQPDLRHLDGRNPAVGAYIETDARFADFFAKMSDLLVTLLPAFEEEGKTYFSVGIGCTGGQHRSVAVAEKLAIALAEKGWRVSTRHRELERQGMEKPQTMG